MKKILLTCLTLLIGLTADAGTTNDSPGIINYWTADGRVMPLHLDDDMLHVPAKAVAVDLRGKNLKTLKFDTSEANPNCLYYMDLPDDLPEGLSNDLNLIRGGEAERIQVADGYDFYCPTGFKAQYIAYMMMPFQTEDELLRSEGYSQTLVLPFDADCVLLYDANMNMETLHTDMIKILKYEGNNGSMLNMTALSDFNELKAYTPYMLGVYTGSRLLFIAEDCEVPKTCEAITKGQGIDYVGTTVACDPIQEDYLYDSYDGLFHHDDGQRLTPFRACMRFVPSEYDAYYAGGHSTNAHESPESFLVNADAWGEQGRPEEQHPVITDIRENGKMKEPKHEKVYDLTGRRIDASHFTLHASLKKKGLYIVRPDEGRMNGKNGKIIIVR